MTPRFLTSPLLRRRRSEPTRAAQQLKSLSLKDLFATVAQSERPVDVVTLAVGPAMANRVRHGLQDDRRGRCAVEIEKPGYSAHFLAPGRNLALQLAAPRNEFLQSLA